MVYLQKRRLQRFVLDLAKLGVECLEDLDELNDAELTGIGFKELHLRRFRNKTYGDSDP